LVFTTGPWRSDWGDHDEPRQVSGIPVAKELLRREGGGGTLVLLADNRFALTGTTYAAGTAHALTRHARRRSQCLPEGDRAWLLSVVEELDRSALAAPSTIGRVKAVPGTPTAD
jgi:cell volume regulation protein A